MEFWNLITNVQALNYSYYFDYITSMSIPFKSHFFVKTRCIIEELLALKVEQYTIHLR